MVEAIALEQAIKRNERLDADPLMLQKLAHKTIAVGSKASCSTIHKATPTDHSDQVLRAQAAAIRDFAY